MIKVRINSVINSIDNPSNSKGLKKGETINISSLGISENNKKTNNWIYNLAPIYKVKSIDLIDSSNFTYEITLNVENIFSGGDSASLVLSDGTKLLHQLLTLKQKNHSQLEVKVNLIQILLLRFKEIFQKQNLIPFQHQIFIQQIFKTFTKV